MAFCASMALGACSSAGAFTWYNELPKTDWQSPANEYTIGIGDSLSIHVYEQEGLGATTKVRSDGRIGLTLIGEVTAAGKHPSAFARELEGRFKEFFVSPRVTVNVEGSQPIGITLLGEVGHTGALSVERPATLLQALAQAGGLTDYADRSRIFVMRPPEYRRVRFTYDALVQNQGGAATYGLRTGDIIVVE
jgi:polysaccharide export outer membrane protein